MPKNFDIDDLSISHDSDNDENPQQSDQLTNMLQGVIDEMLDQTNKKDINPEDL